MTLKNWEKVKELFDSLTEVATDERMQILQALDIETRTALEHLLVNFEAAKSGSGLLDNSPLPHARMLTSVISRLRVFHPGQVLVGRFEVLAARGRGGMGEVYEAFDRVLGERVAIKTVRFDLCLDDDVVTRFKREVQRSRHVTHPNVCRVYDLFSFTGPDGVEVSFMTMELIEGATLFDRVSNSGGLPELEALGIALQLFSGLRAAHDAGIIHRDFKSGNVLLADQSGSTRAVITDFGLARLVTAEVQTVPLTAGRLEGTLAYLAPELLTGHPASRQSDLYALGVVLFRMLTGHYPFVTDLSDLPAAITDRQNPPRVRDSVRDVDERWDLAIQACLEPLPAKRAHSVQAVEKLLTGTPLPAGVRPASRTLKNPLNRRELLIGGGTTAAVLAGLGLFHFYRPTNPLLKSDHVKTLVEDFTSSPSPALGRAVRSLFRIALAHSPKVLLVKPKDVRKALEDLDIGIVPVKGATARTIAENLGVHLALAGEVYTAGAGYRLRVTAIEPASGRKLGEFDDSVRDARDLPVMVNRAAIRLGLTSGNELAGPQVEGAPLDQADTGHPDALEMLAAGLERYQNGEFEVAREFLQEAIAIDHDFAIAHVYLAAVHGALRRWDLAYEPASIAYKLRGKISGRQRHHAEALFYVVSGDYDNALQTYRVLEQLYPNDAQVHRSLAQAWAVGRRPDLELEQIQEAVKLDPQNPLNHTMRASALADVGRFSDARKSLEQAERVLPGAPLLLAAKGYVSLLQSDIAGALQHYGQLAASAPDPQIQWLARTYEMRALLLGGKIGEARSRLDQDLPVIAFRKDDANESLYHYWSGQVFAFTGEGAGGAEHAAALAQKDAIPPYLFSLRAAAELAGENRDADLLDQVHRKLNVIADKNPSTRSNGICAQCEGLLASAEGRTADAAQLFSKAHAFWPDISCASSLADALLKSGDNQAAFGFYKQVLDAKWAALRFECVLLWIRSVAMAGHALKALGRPREAMGYFDEFLRHWGTNQQISLVQGVVEAQKDCRKKIV